MGVFWAALSALLYGCIGYFGVNLMQAGFSVCDLLFWRFFVSLLMLVPCLFIVYKSVTRPSVKSVISLFFISALFYGGGTACYFEASKTIGTGLAMIIFFTYPIFVALLSILTKKAVVTLPTVIALILIIIGSFFIAFGDGINMQMDLIGLSFGLASGVGYGFYVFGSKESSKNLSPQFSAFIVCAGNTAAFSVYSIFTQGEILVPYAQYVWTDILLFALIGTVLPIFLLLHSLKTLSASKASIIGVLEPVAVLAVGAIVLKEEVTWPQLLGSVIILLSAISVQFEKNSVNEKSVALAKTS